ncbi:LUD domain-containing protein [Streptacidiphilus sp. P02-A3a]|uniref:LutC/YkgG family protein n=1 Tax=Streptacidiphilus sp. P02-A3a TaxID=2704468 RepID=UPI0015FE3AC8|nr:LUD domain-containing protein [Streptacidiphilus sp. P02-A3a]QMU69507.1 lactate utilization protein C [Streptacidiphilus sp. P02-A3a]
MTTRETVLARIRSALADVPEQETPELVAVPRDYRRSHADEDVVALFAERVADYRARVLRVGRSEARAAVAGLLAERGVRTLVVPSGFPEELLPPGPWQCLADTPPLDVTALDAADGVLTTAALGIAVTGTLVLDAGPGQGRRALTLLPDYHLCVIREEQILGDVPEAIAALDPARPLTFVSGPSATSDIELQRVEGVHGPRTLHVLVIADSPTVEPA